MKFSRPINREVDINGNTFIVTLDETGVGFRLKGKRKTARADWSRVLEIAQGEQGETASEFLGFAESTPQSLPQATGSERAEENQEGDRFSRTATVGETDHR